MGTSSTRRLLAAALLVTAGLAAGCGGSKSSSSSTPASASAVVKAGSAAIGKQTSVGFRATIALTLHGQLKAAGPEAAFLHGPISLALSGHATTKGQPEKADIQFSLNFSGGSLSGHLLTPDGKTGYLQLPSVMGPGWHSFPISTSAVTGSSGNSSSAQGKALLSGIQPQQWLKNLTLTSGNGVDTVSAELSVTRMLASIAASSNGAVSSAQKAELAKAAAGVKTASGSISYGSSDHLPTAAHFELNVDVPAALAKSAQGLQGFDLKVDSSFSDWSQDFTVTKPASSTPLSTSTSSLLGAGA